MWGRGYDQDDLGETGDKYTLHDSRYLFGDLVFASVGMPWIRMSDTFLGIRFVWSFGADFPDKHIDGRVIDGILLDEFYSAGDPHWTAWMRDSQLSIFYKGKNTSMRLVPDRDVPGAVSGVSEFQDCNAAAQKRFWKRYMVWDHCQLLRDPAAVVADLLGRKDPHTRRRTACVQGTPDTCADGSFYGNVL